MYLTNNTVVQYQERYKKNIAIDMRKHGMSYSEIQNKLNVPKATLSFWLKSISLTSEQSERLQKKRTETAQKNIRKRILETQRQIEEVNRASETTVRNISKRELWFMGILLCWRGQFLGEKVFNTSRGLQFTSSDPYLIRFFLKWLSDVGGIESGELLFDIFLKENNRDSKDMIIGHWSRVTGFDKSKFTRVYFQKTNENGRNIKGSRRNIEGSWGNIKGSRKKKYIQNNGSGQSKKSRKVIHSSDLGLLRVRIRDSRLLAGQVAGWIRGLQKYYWKDA